MWVVRSIISLSYNLKLLPDASFEKVVSSTELSTALSEEENLSKDATCMFLFLTGLGALKGQDSKSAQVKDIGARAIRIQGSLLYVLAEYMREVDETISSPIVR
jgi:hypothetical protein